MTTVKDVARKALFRAEGVDDSMEILPYPVAFWGMLLGMAGMAVWLWLSGFPFYASVLFLVLAFVMIPLLVGPLVWDMSPREESTFLIIDYFIWALFAVDLIVKVLISPHRLNYLKKHWLEVLVVIVPFFRPLRILRIFIFGSRAWVGMRRLVNIDFLLVYGIGLVIIAGVLLFLFFK